MATKMKMVMKGGKKVPAFAADGKGKMKMGGVKMKKYETGGGTDPATGSATPATGFEKRQAKKIAKAKTRAAVAEIEGEGTVANKRKNLATNVATGLGTVRGKVPKSVSTSNSTSNSITKDSGNTSTYNNTSSGSSSGSYAGADAGANSSSNINGQPKPGSGGRRVSNTPVTPKQKRGGSTKAIKPKMKVGGSTTKLKKAMYGSTMKPTMMAKPSMMKKGGTKKK